LFATRRGKQSLGSLLTALQRLQRDGWLRAEPTSDDGAVSGLRYSLTADGEQRIEEGKARLESMLSQFVEHGDMDKSFQHFLDLKRQVNGN
jgi:DNA-binding PadR family transcriptional regulator